MCNCEVEEARKKFGIECDMTEEESSLAFEKRKKKK
jgi:hypothetical protein